MYLRKRYFLKHPDRVYIKKDSTTQIFFHLSDNEGNNLDAMSHIVQMPNAS